jgi:OOP family OmpA-OmpF porin
VLCTSALAQLPATIEHVDRKAPCFQWPAPDQDRDGVYDRLDRCGNTPRGAVVDEWGCPIDSDSDGVYDGLDKCPGTPPGEAVDANGCSGSQRSGAPRAAPPPPPPPPPAPAMSTTERQLVEGGRIRLENVYFETGSARLLPESEATLDEVGAVLEKFPELRLEVQGHSDTRGSNRSNRTLSQSRAESVRTYLLDHFRLRGDRVTAKGYGETQPETRERNEEERLRNRRVEIAVLNPEVLPRNVKVEHRP